MNSPIMTGAFDKRLWDRFKTKSAKYSWLRHYETSSDIRSQGWTSAVERLRPGRKRSPSGAFGGWNDLDRMVKWREGGDETNPIALCLVRRALLRCGGGATNFGGKIQHSATSRIPLVGLEQAWCPNYQWAKRKIMERLLTATTGPRKWFRFYNEDSKIRELARETLIALFT